MTQAVLHVELQNQADIRVAGLLPLNDANNRIFDSELIVSIVQRFEAAMRWTTALEGHRIWPPLDTGRACIYSFGNVPVSPKLDHRAVYSFTFNASR